MMKSPGRFAGELISGDLVSLSAEMGVEESTPGQQHLTRSPSMKTRLE